MYLIKCYKDGSCIPIYVSTIRDVCSFMQANLFFYEKVVVIDLERSNEERKEEDGN